MIAQPATPLSALRTFPLLRRGKPSQFGAAILLAMLVVTLVATLAAGLQWRQWRAYSQEAAQRTQTQAAWVLVGALDWARLVLRQDAQSVSDSNNTLIDHLAEPWALPLKEAKLSTFLSADSLIQEGEDQAFLSGQITDAQSKINLTNLSSNGQLDKATYSALGRLFEQLGLPGIELEQLSQAWLSSEAPPGIPTSRASPSPSPPLRPSRLDELGWLGLSTSSMLKLAPYLTVLPERTSVNLNTAPALVLYAVIPEIDMTKAQSVLLLRAQTPFKNIDLAGQLLGGISMNGAQHAVSSQYFEIRGRLRLGDWLIDESSLVKRTGQEVKAVWRQRGAF